MNHWTHHDSPLGRLLLMASEEGLTGLYFEQHQRGREPQGVQDREHSLLKETARQLDAYFARRLKRFDLPLDLQGTPFQLRVWQGLQSVGYGALSTYTQQARLAGRDNAVRATGAAIGRNPVCIILPCHRIVAQNGGLTGYAGGLERKRLLLALEQSG